MGVKSGKDVTVIFDAFGVAFIMARSLDFVMKLKYRLLVCG
jgi:hypothetical protein